MDSAQELAPTPRNKKQVIVFGILLILALALSFFFFRGGQVSPESASKQPTSQTPTGPFYSVLGELTSVKQNNSLTTLEIKASWGEVYKIDIEDSTKLLPIEPPSRQIVASGAAQFKSQDLKVGQQLNISAQIDLSKNVVIKANQLKSVEVYLND